MTTPTPEIRKAFYSRLLGVLPLGEITESDVAWPNVQFRPQTGRMYLAPAILYGETNTASLSEYGFEKLGGIFQVSIYGVADTGEAAIEEVARALTDQFRAGTALALPCANEALIRKTYRSGLEFFDARPVVIVSVNWIQYTQKGE